MQTRWSRPHAARYFNVLEPFDRVLKCFTFYFILIYSFLHTSGVLPLRLLISLCVSLRYRSWFIPSVPARVQWQRCTHSFVNELFIVCTISFIVARIFFLSLSFSNFSLNRTVFHQHWICVRRWTISRKVNFNRISCKISRAKRSASLLPAYQWFQVVTFIS